MPSGAIRQRLLRLDPQSDDGAIQLERMGAAIGYAVPLAQANGLCNKTGAEDQECRPVPAKL